jgi:hypothetical protein
MKKIFNDILSIEDVSGIILFSFKGELIFKEFKSSLSEEPETRDWWGLFIRSLNGAREADLVFEKIKFYIRKTEIGYLIVLMGIFVPTAMVRLNCDMLLPALNQMKTSKVRKGIFKKKR